MKGACGVWSYREAVVFSRFFGFFGSTDATEFQRAFVAWTARLTGGSPDVIALDGKPSFDIVSAVAACQRLCGRPHQSGEQIQGIIAIPCASRYAGSR
jgi:hypothetical protein